MSLKIQLIIVISLILALVVIIYWVRKRALELKYVIAWMGCDLAVIILVLFPKLIKSISYFLGIYSPMNMLFFMGFVFSLILIFFLTTALSRLSVRVRNMAQQVALLEDRLEKEINNK